MICEDNVGGVSGHTRWGVYLTSEDGVTDWHPTDPIVVYNHSITWSDGTGIHCQRRERPQLRIDEHGHLTHLFTSILFQGNTWNQAVPISFKRK